jgi:hypothetical protein
MIRGTNFAQTVRRILRKRTVFGALLLSVTLLEGFGLGYLLLASSYSSVYSPTVIGCGVGYGSYCPGQFTYVSGQVNVTVGIPNSIAFVSFSDPTHLSVSAPTLTAGVYREHGRYGYGLYVPAYVIVRGGTVNLYNTTRIADGGTASVAYHAIIYLSNTTSSCAAQPNVFTPSITAWNHQDFSC